MLNWLATASPIAHLSRCVENIEDLLPTMSLFGPEDMDNALGESHEFQDLIC